MLQSYSDSKIILQYFCFKIKIILFIDNEENRNFIIKKINENGAEKIYKKNLSLKKLKNKNPKIQ